MCKKFFLFVIFIVIFFLSTGTLRAEDQFIIDSRVIYNVQESGVTIVTHEIVLENAFSDLYATSYTLSLSNINAQNISALGENGEKLTQAVERAGIETNIKVSFNDSVVGKGKKRHFSVSYNEDSFATRTGEVWEVKIPRLSDETSFRNYSISLSIPLKFGLEAYISPKAESSSVDNSLRIYNFSKQAVSQTGITAGFGEFQVFSFTFSYHLENPLTKRAETQIALPPDTAFQKLYYQKLDPRPKDVLIDKDGNWMAVYELAPRERIDVTAAGSVQIFASFRSFPGPTVEELSDNLKPATYWEVDDPQIKELADTLKTPKAIYDYVRTHLKYDVERVKPNLDRLGAKKALASPESAICMEFTDLFIAIARAAGIPAREINGYAYTENSEIQPLSLVSDVLHSWPEYWDGKKGVWIPIDPTWAETTGGVDYFNKLDLRHFTFVIHGQDSQKPFSPGSYKLGANPQKDVFVSFGRLPETRASIAAITAEPIREFPFLETKIIIHIANSGPTSLYQIYPTYYFDNKLHGRDYIEILPPFSSYQTSIRIPYSFLGKNTPEKVKVVVNGAQVEVPTYKVQAVAMSLLGLSSVFIIIIVFVLFKTKKIVFLNLFAKIRNVYRKKTNSQTT